MPGMGSRIARLERLFGGNSDWKPYSPLSDVELHRQTCEALGIDEDELSRSHEEAAAKGFSSIMAEVADILEIDLRDLAALLNEGDDRHWQWFSGKCYVRE